MDTGNYAADCGDAQEALDEPSIILRWLAALGPEHRVASLPMKNAECRMQN
jgi:hypothetical protein